MNKKYFKIPQSIFQSNLSSSEWSTVLALYQLKNQNNGKISIKQKDLQSITGIKSIPTLQKAINKLCELDIILNKTRHLSSKNHLPGVYQYELLEDDTWVNIDNNIFSYGLRPRGIRLYAFINYWIGDNEYCEISYNQISAQSRTTRSQTFEIMNELKNKKVIIAKYITKDDGSYSNNRYYLNIK
ncbi:MAG: hypothetical protein U0O22_00665 [Acutalibacteraceae bacterium]